MEYLVSVLAATVGIIGTGVAILFFFCLALRVAKYVGIDTSPVPTRKVFKVVTAVTLALSVYAVFTSPITRPTINGYDKGAELIKYKHNHPLVDVDMELVDKTFVGEDVDVSPNQEAFDKVTKHANERYEEK